MLFTTKEIANYFGHNAQWVYHITDKLGIKWIKQRQSSNGISKINLYNIIQRNQIEQHLFEEYTKLKNKIIIVETSYHIFESKSNQMIESELNTLLMNYKVKLTTPNHF